MLCACSSVTCNFTNCLRGLSALFLGHARPECTSSESHRMAVRTPEYPFVGHAGVPFRSIGFVIGACRGCIKSKGLGAVRILVRVRARSSPLSQLVKTFTAFRVPDKCLWVRAAQTANMLVSFRCTVRKITQRS